MIRLHYFYDPRFEEDAVAAMFRHKMRQKNLSTTPAPFLARLRFTLAYILRGGHKPAEQERRTENA